MAIPGLGFLNTIVERRTLLFQLVRRDFQQRFVGSAAGWIWAIIHPLVLLLSWVFVFQWCLEVPLPRGEVTQNYTLFLFAGYLPWLLFQETVLRSPAAVIDHSRLITKTLFPAEIVPVAVFLSSLITHLMTVGIVTLAVAIWLRHWSPMILALPAYTLLVGLFSVGLGWLVAGLHVYLRDTAQFVMVLLNLWFWMTPIFLSETQFPEQVHFLVRANPLAYLVKAYRERILSARPFDFSEFGIAAAYAVGAFVIGGLAFRYLKRGFADVL